MANACRSNSDHFKTFDYDGEFPPHITNYYVRRKCKRMIPYLMIRSLANYPLYGLDMGCGTGHHVDYFNNVMGICVTGEDINYDAKNPFCFYGDMLNLWMTSSCCDFVYYINSLHHLDSKDQQVQALKEGVRVLQSGGLLFIHEMNLRNYFIRNYLRGIFKEWWHIDQGGECWFDAELLKQVPELELVAVEYFTFTPNFCPKILLPLFAWFDRFSDGKWWSKWGAHVMYVLKKQ